MKNITFNYNNSLVSPEKITQTLKHLSSEIDTISYARTQQYNSPYASINLPFDHDTIREVNALAQKKLTLQPKAIIVIGIGGSSLGTIAVLEALQGKFYNDHQEIQFYCIETVDSDTTTHVFNLAENILKNGNTILVNVVSKSGSTTETIANFKVFLSLLKKYYPHNYHEYIVTTTDKDSILYKESIKLNFSVLTIPTLVGGRYSVFSAVGLFPLIMCGINCQLLLEGAAQAVNFTLSQSSSDPAALSASIVWNLYAQNYKTHDTFLFSVDLESVGKWYRQLLGESIGKEYNNENKQVHIGINPTVSIGSNDLHSVGQFYLAGPHTIFTTFITTEHNKTTIVVPHSELETVIPIINGVQFSTIMNAIFHGTTIAYAKNKLPFVTFILPEKSEFYIGQFMQIKMIEIIYLGFLFNINPFDQPNVELYKKETRNILTKNK